MIRDIESPQVARDVARRVKRGRRALVVKSMKCPGGDLRVESALERDVATFLDLDPRVIELTSQPFSIEIESCLILPLVTTMSVNQASNLGFTRLIFFAAWATEVSWRSMQSTQASLLVLNLDRQKSCRAFGSTVSVFC